MGQVSTSDPPSSPTWASPKKDPGGEGDDTTRTGAKIIQQNPLRDFTTRRPLRKNRPALRFLLDLSQKEYFSHYHKVLCNQYPESLAHLLNGCVYYTGLMRECHNSVLSRVAKTTNLPGTKLLDQKVPGSGDRLRPDLLIRTISPLLMLRCLLRWVRMHFIKLGQRR